MSKVYSLRVLLAALTLGIGVNTVQAQSPLTPVPASVPGLTFTKGTGAANPASVVLTVATSTTFFTIDATTVPIWLTLDKMNGTAGTTASAGGTIAFSASSVSANLGAGVFSANVHIVVLGKTDLVIPVTLQIKNSAATLSVKETNTVCQAIPWSIGSAYPTCKLTLVSSNEPISFTASVASTTTTNGAIANWMTVSPKSGVAFTLGTPVVVTFDPLAFLEAQAADTLTGTLTITPATGAPIVLTVSYLVKPPVPTVTSLFPASVPVDTTSTDSVTIVINGTNFVTAPSAEKTIVTVAGVVDADTGYSAQVINATTIIVTIPVLTNTYFATPESTLAIGVYNPTGGTISAFQASANLIVTAKPIVMSVSSASTFAQASPGTNPTVAPYDIVSIFGTNLCPDCGASSLSATPDSFGRFPAQLSPDAGVHNIKVAFNKASGGALIAQAFLLFANNTQINLLVPSTVTTVTPTLIGAGTVNVVASYVTTVGPVSADSTPYLVNIAAVSPGVFTTNANGQGQGAILQQQTTPPLPDVTLNSATNPAIKGTTTVMIYMTGLGAPTSTAANVVNTAAATCISALDAVGPPAVVGYQGTINTAVTGYVPPSPIWPTIDGAVILSSKLKAGHFPPCFANSAITVTIGGTPATVSYAGFVSDSIVGLFQVNAAVPGTTGVATAVAVPVIVSIGGVASQKGVTLYTK